MNKHTPGPWKVWNDRIWTDEPLDEMREICSISGNRGDRDANAAFIVRACNDHEELLDLLKLAIARVELANAEGNNILSAWLPDARAAIARAAGGE